MRVVDAEIPPHESFCRSLNQAPLIWRIVDNIARAVGEKVWPHAIRHTSISEVVDQSRDVRLGRILAGHGSISTTQRYLDNLENGELDRQATGIAAGALGNHSVGSLRQSAGLATPLRTPAPSPSVSEKAKDTHAQQDEG